MRKFKVHIYVTGAPFRPAYDGHVEVFSDSWENAARAAVDKLRRTTFQDVCRDSFIVKSVARAVTENCV